MLKPEEPSQLEIIVSRQDLGRLPDHIVKIRFAAKDMIIDPKKRSYAYGTDAVLEIDGVQIKISPAEDSVYINHDTFYVKGVVHIIVKDKTLHSQSYSRVEKFIQTYQQRLEKERISGQSGHRPKY